MVAHARGADLEGRHTGSGRASHGQGQHRAQAPAPVLAATPIEQLPLKLSSRLRPWELHRLQKELHRRDEQALDRPVEISGPVESFHAAGYLGQYILVVPSEELVVVRLSWSEDLAPGVELDFQGLVPRSMALVRGVPDGGFDE